MYSINRGTGFTRALFMNCDHSLLTYSFYKQPKFVLKLFQIRLREIIKINLLPAAIIGGGLSVLLYASGGTDHAVNYVVLFVSVDVYKRQIRSLSCPNSAAGSHRSEEARI